MKRKIKVICQVPAVLIAVCLVGCGVKKTAGVEQELLTPAEAVVDIEPVMYRDLYTITTRDAELAPYTEELSFNAGGSISKLYVDIGSEVKAGDLIAEQEEEGVRTAANNALNKYLSEKKVYMDAVKSARRKLAENPGKEEREWQELLLSQAEELWEMQEPDLWNAWEQARARVGNSKIFAPFDGVITACLTEGTDVAAGQPVIAVADTDRLYITVGSYLSPSGYETYEKVYALINGKEVELTYVQELMEEEGTFTYYTAKDLDGVKTGDFVLICMRSNFHGNVLSVPLTAVYKDSNGDYVYLMENGAKVRRDVITGYKNNVYIEIVDGLQEGDRVYVKK